MIIFKRWWVFVLIVDFFLIAQTILYAHTQNFSQQWRLITPFTLNIENNIAAWWSSMTLLAASILCFQKYINNANKTGIAWLIFAGLFAGLSLDEIGSIHERVGGWSRIIPIALVFSILVFFSLLRLFKHESSRKSASYLLIGFFLFASVVVQEYIEHIVEWKPWMLGIRAGIEEGTELFGIFFILMALVNQQETQSQNILNSLLVKRDTLLKLRFILAITLLIHAIGSYVIIKYGDPLTKTGDPRYYGNPMNWYPTSVFLLSSMLAMWKLIHFPRVINIKWLVISLACILCSMDVATNIFVVVIPNLSSFVNISYVEDNFLILYILQLLIVCILAWENKEYLIRHLALGTLIIFIVIFTIYANQSIWLRYFSVGFLAYFLYIALITHRARTQSS